MARSLSSSSGSESIVSSSSQSQCKEISMRSLSGGMLICSCTKYGMTWKVAIGQSNTEPSSSKIIYMPPLFCKITISGPIYLVCILQLNDFSIAVF